MSCVGSQLHSNIMLSTLHILSNLIFIATMLDGSHFPYIADEEEQKLSLKSPILLDFSFKNNCETEINTVI